MSMLETLALNQSVAPTLEPITLLEAKTHLRVDSGSLDDNLTVGSTILPDEYSAGTETGTGVDVSNSQVLAVFSVGTVVATGTVDVKLQESDDDNTYTDVSGGTFTQVTPANDNAVYELEYTGSKQYIRAHATIANANATFAVNIDEVAPTSAEDTLITTLITVARQYVEDIANISIMNQTWEYYLNSFHDTHGNNGVYDRRRDYDSIWLPNPPLSSVTSVEYTISGDSTDYSNTFSSDNYHVDTVRKPGRIVLIDGATWPSDTLETNNPVKITYIAGFGSLQSDVPEALKNVILIVLAELYENREDTVFSMRVERLGWYKRMLAQYRNWWPM